MYNLNKISHLLKIFTICSALVNCTSASKEFQYFSNVKHNKLSNRIADGQDAEPAKYHYQVGIIVRNETLNHSVLCAGSLIAPKYILTTASCVKHTESVSVLLGTYNLNVLNKVIKVNPENIIIHEDFHFSTFTNDIALIELPEIVEENDFIKIIKLVDKESEFDKAIVTGWRKKSYNLKKVEVNSLSAIECKRVDGSFAKVIRNTHICAEGKLSEPLCNFSSGSPLIINQTLIGISSFRHVNCQLGYPPIFTRLSKYQNWINEKMLSILTKNETIVKGKMKWKPSTKSTKRYLLRPTSKSPIGSNSFRNNIQWMLKSAVEDSNSNNNNLTSKLKKSPKSDLEKNKGYKNVTNNKSGINCGQVPGPSIILPDWLNIIFILFTMLVILICLGVIIVYIIKWILNNRIEFKIVPRHPPANGLTNSP